MKQLENRKGDKPMGASKFIKTFRLRVNKDGKTRITMTTDQILVGKDGDYFHLIAEVEKDQYVLKRAGSLTPPEAFGAEVN